MRIISFFYIAFLAASAFSQESTAKKCISHQDLVEISQNFVQFKSSLKANKTEYCIEDLGNDPFILLETLVLLKNIKINRVPYLTLDDLSIRVIQNDNWWDYLTSKVKRFDLKPKACPGNIAYVWLHILDEINLCKPFFIDGAHDSYATTIRLTILLHEARHLEAGEAGVHIACSAANQEKKCDSSIKDHGAFAAEIQALVDIAFHSNITGVDKHSLISHATRLSKVGFKTSPSILYSNNVFLQNNLGEIWQWQSNGQEPIKLVYKLKENSRMFINPKNLLTVFPNNQAPAYRLDLFKWQFMQTVGTYAEEYNRLTPEEKDQKLYFDYLNKAILSKKDLTIDCYIEREDILMTTGKPPEDLKILFSLEEKQDSIFALSHSGKVYETKCPKNKDQKPQLQLTKMTMPQNLKRFFVLNKINFGLTDQGKFVQLERSGSNFVIQKQIDFGLPNEQWTDLVVNSIPQLFEEMFKK